MASPRNDFICVTSRSMRASSCFSSCFRSASGSFGPLSAGRPPGPVSVAEPEPAPPARCLAPGFAVGFATMAVSLAARTVDVVGVVAGVVFRTEGSAAGLLRSFGAACACTTAHASAAAQAEASERARVPTSR